MSTTLTREAIFEKAKPRTKLVDVPGWGKVWLRSWGEVRRSMRMASIANDDGSEGMSRLYRIVDQVLCDETTPMFTDADVPKLAELDGEKLDALNGAIVIFNHDEDPK